LRREWYARPLGFCGWRIKAAADDATIGSSSPITHQGKGIHSRKVLAVDKYRTGFVWGPVQHIARGSRTTGWFTPLIVSVNQADQAHANYSKTNYSLFCEPAKIVEAFTIGVKPGVSHIRLRVFSKILNLFSRYSTPRNA
jgi:hypothetical protein